MLRLVSARQWRSPTAAMRIFLPSSPRRVLHRIRLVAAPALDFELPRIEVALHVGLVEVLLPREQRAAADALRGGRLILALLQPADQRITHAGTCSLSEGNENRNAIRWTSRTMGSKPCS